MADHTYSNFFVYGDAGLKSDFGGHDNWHESNVYAYTGSCFGKGNNLRFVNNSCILRGDHGYSSDCGLPTGMEVYGNAVYTPSGELKVCGATSLTAWVAAGHDRGSSLHTLPTDDEVIEMGRNLLGIRNGG